MQGKTKILIPTLIICFLTVACVMPKIFPWWLNGSINTSNGSEIVPMNIGKWLRPETDYSLFNLNTPKGGTAIPSSTMKSYPSSGTLTTIGGFMYPGTGAYTGYDMMQTPLYGTAISGSSYLRTELREIIPGTTGTNVYWIRYGYHSMIMDVKGECVNAPPRLTSVPSPGSNSRTCICQVWCSTNKSGSQIASMFCLYYGEIASSGGNVTRTFQYLPPRENGPTSNLPSPYSSLNIPMETPFTVEIVVSGGIMTVWIECDSMYNGAATSGNKIAAKRIQIVSEALEDPGTYTSTGYFMAGNYDRSSSPDGSVPDPNVKHTSIGLRRINIEHNPLKGRLRYNNGDPVANATVQYVFSGGSTNNSVAFSVQTDYDGYYYIPNVPSHGGTQTATINIVPPQTNLITSGLISTNPGASLGTKYVYQMSPVAVTTITGVRTVPDIVYT
jgi:hypothetical protein